MDNQNTEIIEKLKAYKEQGLNYYQATQKLKELGFTDEQISSAGASFPYSDISAPADGNNLNAVGDIKEASPTPQAEESLGKAMLNDKKSSALNSRFFVYGGVFVVGFAFGWAIMDLYLVPRWFGPAANIFTHSPSYLNARVLHYKYIYPAEAGVAGGVLLTIIYTLYNLFTGSGD